MSKAKRVRFDKDEKDGDPVCASSRGRKEEAQSPRAGAPKTSEYAYFKKVKNGAVRGHSHSLHKENELKNSKINFLARDTSGESDRIKPSTKDLRFSVSGEREGPSDHDLFLSPRISKKGESDSKKSKEIPNKIKMRQLFLSENVKPTGQSPCSPPPNKASENSELPNDEFKARPSFRSQNVTVVGQSPFSPRLNKASENSENQCSDKGIFSSKRQRLRQWIAHTYPEVEKLHPKGFDLVSALLSRLFPKDNESKDSSNRDTDNSKSPKSDKFSTLEKGLQLSYKRDCHKDLPKICSGRSSEIVPSGLNTFVSGFPFPNYGTESHAQDELMYLDQRSTNYIQKSSHTQHEFSFCSPLERYRPPGIFHLKELDDFGSMMEDTRKEPHRLLLGSDSECRNYISDSSIITHDTARNVRPKLATSWNVDQRHIMDDVLDAERLCPSSLSNHLLEFNSFPTPGSTSYLTKEFGSNSDDKKYAMAEPRQFSLALPSTQAEDGHSEDVLSNGDIIFSYRNQHGLNDNVLDSKPPTDVFWNFLSAPAFSTENSPSIFHTWHKKSLYSFPRLDEASGAPFTSLYESAFNRHNSPSKFLSAEDPPSIFHTWKFPETKKSLYSFRRLDEAAFNRNISPSKFLSAAEDPPSIIHAWEFPQNTKSLYSLSRLEEAPGEPVTRFYEENPPSNFHAWQFPQNKKDLFSFSRLEEAPGKPVTRFFEEDHPPSTLHAWQFPQNPKTLYSYQRLEEVHEAHFTPLSEGTLNHHTLPSNFEASLDTFINPPFLLDHTNSYDRPRQELYFDDDDN